MTTMTIVYLPFLVTVELQPDVNLGQASRMWSPSPPTKFSNCPFGRCRCGWWVGGDQSKVEKYEKDHVEKLVNENMLGKSAIIMIHHMFMSDSYGKIIYNW